MHTSFLVWLLSALHYGYVFGSERIIKINENIIISLIY